VDDFNMRPARDLGLTPFERLRSVRRESGPFLSACQFLWAIGSRGYFCVWHRLEIIGREHLPSEPPFVLCSNHSSHLDALALAAPLRLDLRDRVFALAAGDVFFESAVPTAFAAGLINALPVWRKRRSPRALQELREKLLETPCGFIIFPEGSRTRDGNYLPFKAGIGMLVAMTDVPVIPCHLRGTFAAFPSGSRLPKPRKITLRIGSPVRFSEVANDRAGWDTICATVEARIKQLGSAAE
jgi:1-acyl-sn-glycerol-3-phosphate acyltransferase